MAEAATKPLPIGANPALPVEEEQFLEESQWERFMDWVRTEFVWYAGSFSFHLVALSVLLLLPNFARLDNQGDAPVLESKAEEDKTPDKPLERMDVADIETKPPDVLDVDPTLEKPAVAAQDADFIDKDKDYHPKTGDGGGAATSMTDLASARVGATVFGPGPKITGATGLGPGDGKGKNYGDSGSNFGSRGSGNRKAMLAQGGGTKHTERAVTAALVWLAKHQDYDGHWSLSDYTAHCADKTCTGGGEVFADAGGTAMGLLPFLAAGQTHRSKGPYMDNVRRGIGWLIGHQQSDGNLAKGAQSMMYSHGLATIALCEAYGLTGDKDVGRAAQGAVTFILAAQNTADGGWRYMPKDPGDTSVVGWQIMALKSAHMAGLDVGGSVFSGASKWLDLVSVNNGSEYCYQENMNPTPTMTSVGLLCRQYLGAKRNNPMLTGGMTYLMNHLPDERDFTNVYYWYYATQVMHNMSGSEWDTWNRKMRDLLVHSQIRDVNECANGSWAPEKDPWGRRGGRVMQTSLSTLTLEIYYRYLPLFKAEASGDNGNDLRVAATSGAATAGRGAAAKSAASGKVSEVTAPDANSTKGGKGKKDTDGKPKKAPTKNAPTKNAAGKKAASDASDSSDSQ